MRSQTFAGIARWCLILAVSAGPSCLADTVITGPTPSDISLSMLEIEQELFGFDPADGYSIAQQNQLWTSNANAALYSNLLALITTLGGDDSLIAQLFQPGAIFAGEVDPAASTGSQPLIVTGDESLQPSVPEPATMGLFGGALLFLCCYALVRSGRVRHPGDAPPWADTTS